MPRKGGVNSESSPSRGEGNLIARAHRRVHRGSVSRKSRHFEKRLDYPEDLYADYYEEDYDSMNDEDHQYGSVIGTDTYPPRNLSPPEEDPLGLGRKIQSHEESDNRVKIRCKKLERTKWEILRVC